MSYDGIKKDAEVNRTSNQESLQLSERYERKKGLKEIRKQERPAPMRSEVVDKYFQQVQKETNGAQAEVFKEIYRNVMDNRIFNNLKQQLNEMIEDEKSLISIEEFRKMFFTFFKGELKASILYEKLLPYMIVYNVGDKVFNDLSEINRTELQGVEPEKMVSIQKLSIFIDSFNFSPVPVHSIRHKNDSNGMTYVMTSNTKGSLAAKDNS